MTLQKASQKYQMKLGNLEARRNLLHVVPKQMLTSARNQLSKKSVAYLRAPHCL